MIRNSATERQVQAADPSGSTWLSANAGSGKTRVLTDRVARLLLADVEPQRILCLTYTKAAASEMQNRLFRRLGGWAMLDETSLRAALADLGIEGRLDGETLAKARRLFARAIETPGGLRIQTIHSFCASLLRRFPLEAGVSPQFTEMDDRAARLLRDEIVEELADSLAPEAVLATARAFTGEDFAQLTEEIARNRSGLARALTHQEVMALFGLPDDMTADHLIAQVFLGGEAEWLAEVCVILDQGKKTDIETATKLRGLNLENPDPATLAQLEAVCLFTKSAAEPFTAKLGKLPTKDMQAALGPLLNRLEDLMRRVEAARPRRLALAAAKKTLVLHRFAQAFLPEYDRRKAARGLLDFDDLISRARALLTNPSVAQWVLFRLDGGIDHILVDEAQDTSPEQWRVIELLAQEFTAGRGARDVARTIFVVGDKKQSIYSFQGADLEVFDRMRAHFSARLAEAQTGLTGLTLEYSFRSAEAILRLVDLTFDARAGLGLGGEVKHLAFRADMPGRVDLWPPLAPVSDPEQEEWFDPVDLISDEHHAAQLARKIATEIGRMISGGVQVPDGNGTRPVRAGDFLILVQRRSVLFTEIIRACKAAGLPIAGADRLKLGAELAVKDVAALLSFLATPEDDLSLAAALRSPLFGWTEAQLYDLAQPRKGYLWEALRDRAADFPDTLATLQDLRNQADFMRPFDLIERALTRHDGRRRLLARLGPEAEDGIDELLSQALAYERNDVPSLTGFLTWLETDDVEVKRQMDSASNRIRVMTVHGAKGLEAPVVILPDTADRPARERNELFALEGGTVVWKTAADHSPEPIASARDAAKARAAAENLRLLYVALTRAECWLIVAAAGKLSTGEAWYDLIRRGMEAAGATPLPGSEILRLSNGAWPDAAPGKPSDAPAEATLEPWAASPAPSPAPSPKLMSPSDLGGAKALPGEAGLADEDAAKGRGRQLHRLLEYLPLARRDQWDALAPDLMAAGEDAATPTEAMALLAEVRAVLDAPALAPLFGSGTLAEVPVTAEIGGRRMLGTIDRLIVSPDRVLAVDYKSNVVIPARPEDVPAGLLRQMGAYAAALAQIYPDRHIETALLWTHSAQLMPLPPDIVRAALAAATVP